MEFIIGYDLDSFKEYYKTLHELHRYYGTREVVEKGFNTLGDDERKIIERDPRHLIVWMVENEIVGHAIWHETSTDNMRPGDPRSDSDRETLQHLFGGRREGLVELHEVWLRPEHRGKGYGECFFSFFERYAVQRGFGGIVYYTDNSAAIALCRRRGYKEALEPLEGHGWHVFSLVFKG